MSTPVGYVPRFEVSAPPVAARPFGLFSVAAEGATLEDSGVFERGAAYWSTACDLTTGSLDGWCPSGEKEMEPFAPVRVEGSPFVITSGVFCYAPTFDAETAARAQLARGEQYRAENIFWEQQTTRLDLAELGQQSTAACALGVLEAHAARHYGGSPVLHVPVRYMPVLVAARLVQRDGDRMVTPWGTRVVVGAGYPGGSDATELTLLITGELGMWRSDVIANADFDVRTNERMAIAERLYVLTADCLAASVTVPACPGGDL